MPKNVINDTTVTQVQKWPKNSPGVLSGLTVEMEGRYYFGVCLGTNFV